MPDAGAWLIRVKRHRWWFAASHDGTGAYLGHPELVALVEAELDGSGLLATPTGPLVARSATDPLGLSLTVVEVLRGCGFAPERLAAVDLPAIPELPPGAVG